MARDIEEFLRRAAERRKKAQQGGGQKRPPARPQPSPPPRQTISQRDVVQPRNERPSQPLPSSKPAPVKQESVREHVNRYIDTSDIVEHVEQLGDEVEQADERMEAHLDDVFDHDVGRLSSQKKQKLTYDDGSRNRNTNELAKGIFRLLQNPKTVRQSIMIAEILKPPSFMDEE